MLLNRLLDSTDLISFSTLQSHDYTSRHGHNPDPSRQNARNATNDSLHFASVNKLTVNTILELLDYISQVEDSNIFVNKELTESLGHPDVLLEFSLLRLPLKVLDVTLTSLVFQSLFRLDQCHGRLRNTMLRKAVHV